MTVTKPTPTSPRRFRVSWVQDGRTHSRSYNDPIRVDQLLAYCAALNYPVTATDRGKPMPTMTLPVRRPWPSTVKGHKVIAASPIEDREGRARARFVVLVEGLGFPFAVLLISAHAGTDVPMQDVVETFAAKVTLAEGLTVFAAAVLAMRDMG